MLEQAHKIIKQSKELSEQGFKLSAPEKFNLSIEFGEGFVSYAILDSVSFFLKKTGSIQYDFSEKRDSYAILFSELLLVCDVVRQGFHSVFLTWNKSGATLVPSAFYSDSKKEELLDFNFGNIQNGVSFVEDVKGLDVKVIYSIPKPMKLFFDTHLSNYKLKHISTSLIEIISSLGGFKNEQRVLININLTNFNLLIMYKGLKFFNTFDFQSAEDILYYVLFSLEQNGVNQETDKIIVAGDIENGSGVHKLLNQYLKNLSFAVIDKNIIRSEALAHEPHHFNYNILNRFVCG